MDKKNLTRRSALAAGGVLLAGLTMGLSACAQEDSLAEQARKGDNKNYVAGDGSVTEFAKADRSAPVALKGTLFDGTAVTPDVLKGKVTVLNFWFAACAPCRVEAPQLEALHQEYKDQASSSSGSTCVTKKPPPKRSTRPSTSPTRASMTRTGRSCSPSPALFRPAPYPPPWCWTRTAKLPPVCWARSKRARSRP